MLEGEDKVSRQSACSGVVEAGGKIQGGVNGSGRKRKISKGLRPEGEVARSRKCKESRVDGTANDC